MEKVKGQSNPHFSLVEVLEYRHSLRCIEELLRTSGLLKFSDSLINRILELKERTQILKILLYGVMRALVESSNDPRMYLNRSSFGGFTEQGKNRDSFKNTIFSQSKIKKLAGISKDHSTLVIS